MARGKGKRGVCDVVGDGNGQSRCAFGDVGEVEDASEVSEGMCGEGGCSSEESGSRGESGGDGAGDAGSGVFEASAVDNGG